MARSARIRVRRTAATWVVVLASVLGTVVAWAQGTTAIVTGAERVSIRRGPGTQFPPFATIAKGSSVDVQEMHGEWARIVTASGQVGYVNSNFLALPGERARVAAPHAPTPHVAAPQAAAPQVAAPQVAAPPVAAPTAAPVPATAAQVEPVALPPVSKSDQVLQTELHGLREELTALKNRPEITAVPGPTAAAASAALDVQQLHAELARLATVVEALERRLDARSPADVFPPPVGASESASHLVSPAAVLLGVLGVVVGWLMGSTQSRKQERGRRSRIRF